MKAVMLYKPDSEAARKVEDFARDFERTQHKPIQALSLETREGADMARLYDMVQNPSILVIRDDGQLLKFWQGDQFPLMNELASYLAL